MAGRKKGTPKTGGRSKGTTNKVTSEFKDIISTMYPDYHPVVAMAIIGNDDGVDESLRLQAHKEVAKYYEPQLKSSEVKQTGETKQTIEFIGGYPSTPKNPASKSS